MYLLPLFLFFCLSCSQQEQITTRNIPKKSLPSLSLTLPFTFIKPTHWVSSPPTALKKVCFDFKEHSSAFLVYLPANQGSLTENINRWRKQLHLPALEKQIERQELKQLKTSVGIVYLYALANESSNEAAEIAFWDDQEGTWFFKLTGSLNIVRQEKEPFFQCIKSLAPL